MPLIYIKNDESIRPGIEQDMNSLLEEYHRGGEQDYQNYANRMKALDIVKVMMGINSDREIVKRFMWKHHMWARFQEYDHEEMMQLA